MQTWTRRLAVLGSGTVLATGLALGGCGGTAAGPAQAASGLGNDTSGNVGGADGTSDGVTATDTPGGTDAPVASKVPVLDLVVDGNRDGIAELANADDQTFSNVFDDKHGASFLANLDDDDGDTVRDADDGVVNGPDDEKDLARVLLAPWPSAPDGATGMLALDDTGAQNVRLFKKNADGTWALVAGVTSTDQGADLPAGIAVESLGCTSDDDCAITANYQLAVADLRSGAEFGVEARRFRASEAADDWDGLVHLTLTAKDGAGVAVKTANAADGKEVVMLRVAPWMLHGNTSPFDRVRSAAFYSAFVADLKIAIGAAGLDFVTYKATSKVNPKHLDYWNDQWTQDLYQTGWTAMPGQGGKMQYMRVANARPWGRAAGDDWLPITWLVNTYLAPDQAVIAIYKEANTGSTYDSHGNHDLLPPYENGDDKFPVGRIIHGSNILLETHAFYNAQQVQGPALVVKTDWLAVGHVDEVLSYAPAKTPRGWKLLVSSDDLALTMYEKAQKDGHGAVTFWSGLSNYDPKTDKQKDAEVSIDATLADVDLMGWSQKAQVLIDGDHDAAQKAVGLKDDEIVFIPCLTEDVGGGSSKKPNNMIAWMPGTVNSLVFGDHIAMPNPFGPTIDGNDLFAKDLQDRVGTAVNQLGHDGMGMKVHLIDDFSSYHIAMGEVHCGTNPEGPPPVGFMWWAVGR